MEKNVNQEAALPDPQTELKAALKKLTEYVQKAESEEVPWHKTVSLIRCVFSEDFRRLKWLEHTSKQQRLVNAVDWIKKNYSIIEKYQQSDDEELKKLADYAINTINRYNHALKKEQASPKNLGEKINRFISEQTGLTNDELVQNPIEVSKAAVVHHDETLTKPTSRLALKAGRNVTVSPLSPSSADKIASVAKPLREVKAQAAKPSIDEINAFQVKANTLITEHGISLDLIRDALYTIKQAPIEATLNKTDIGERTAASIISMRQILSLLPGEVMELTGSFQRIDPSSNFSIPMLETFRLSATSTQTGHPDPRQHNGWALPHALLPVYALRPHQLPLLQPIYQRRSEAQVALLPKGRLNNRARQLYVLKRKAFEKDKETLLKLHFDLNQALIESCPSTPYSEAANFVLPRFFEQLKDHPNALDYLGEAYQKINEAVAIFPNDKLREAYVTRLRPGLLTEDAEGRFQEANTLLREEISANLQNIQNLKPASKHEAESASIDFICAMGVLLSDAVRHILLQHYSEIVGFKPPMLDDFEQKLQACVHKHLINFLDELTSDESLEDEGILEIIQMRMRYSLEEEITLFQAKTFDDVDPTLTEYVHELESYYHARYYARTSKK